MLKAPASFFLQRQQLYRDNLMRRFEIGSQPTPKEPMRNPQMVEIVLYEDRNGDHRYRVDMNGQRREGRVPMRNRETLGTPETLHMIGYVIRQLEEMP